MDAGLLVILLIPVGLLLLLPLLGRLWSAILSYVVFGLIFGFGLMGYFILSNNPGGSALQFAQLDLWLAIFALAMMVLTYFIFRYRKRKIRAKA